MTIILVISKSGFQIKQFFPSAIAMKITLGKSKLSEVVLLSSLAFDEVLAHQKSLLRDMSLLKHLKYQEAFMVQECSQAAPSPAFTGAWDEDPNHVRAGDAWLESCLSMGLTAGAEQSQGMSGLD